MQWWLYAAVFLFAAPWTLQLNEHIRIDILNQRFPRRLRNTIEIVGHVFFLLPMAAIVVWTSWPFFLTSFAQNEQSANYGGLPQWPAKLLIPLGFSVLFIQGVSELIKRIAIMRGELAETEPTRPIRPPPRPAPGMCKCLRPTGTIRANTSLSPSPRSRGEGGVEGETLELIAENLAPIMFAALVVFLLLGYPVAFSLAAVGLMFFVVGVELRPYSGGVIHLSWPLLRTLPERIYGVMGNETLLAIPFFAFMGLILERSGMAEDLLETVGQLFGTVRGGIAYAVVFVGALLAATTGVVAASVISMGLISLPIMLRYGYDARFAAGTIAASGTLAQIVPPSLVLIVMADQLGRSVGDMYTGALLPGLMLAGFYVAYVLVVSTFSRTAAPGLPPEAIALPRRRRIARVSLARASDARLRHCRLGPDARCALSRRRPRHPDLGARRRHRLRGGGGELRHPPQRRPAPALPARRAGRVRYGAATAPHLPRARHHLRRRGDADRGRRHGRSRRHGARRRQAHRRPQSQPLQSRPSCARRRRRRRSCRPSSCSS